MVPAHPHATGAAQYQALIFFLYLQLKWNKSNKANKTRIDAINVEKLRWQHSIDDIPKDSRFENLIRTWEPHKNLRMKLHERTDKVQTDAALPDVVLKSAWQRQLEIVEKNPFNKKQRTDTTSHKAPQTSTLTLTNITMVEAW